MEFPTAAMEADFQEAQRLLLDPPRVQQKSLLLLGSLAAFVLVTMAQHSMSVIDLVTLVGVLLVHELGHAAAMMLVGYRDVRIFFIPLFGAAAAGQRRGVAPWKQTIVLLAGPLPGLIAGSVLLLLHADVPRMIPLQLVIINGLNLLPIVPFDGGQLFQLLLFSRQRHLELLFQAIAAAVLAGYGLQHKWWALVVIGYLLLLTLKHRKRLLDVAYRWRDRSPPEDPAALDEEQRRALYRDAWDMLPPAWQSRWQGKPKPQAATMQQILDRASQRPMSWRSTAAVLLVWAGTVAFAAVPLVDHFAVHWRPYTNAEGHFTALMPGEPRPQKNAGPGGTGVIVDLGRRAYSVAWFALPAGADEEWPARAIAAMRSVYEIEHAQRGSGSDMTAIGHKSGLTLVIRVLSANGRAYVITAGAPDEEDNSWKFVRSVVPTP